MLPNVLPGASTGLLSGFLMLRTGRYRELTVLGSVLLTLGTGLYIMLDVDTAIGVLVVVEIMAGMGSGFLFEPPMVALQAVTPQEDIASATAAFGFVRNLATAISIVLGAIVFQHGMDQKEPTLRAAGLNVILVEAFTGKHAQANVGRIREIEDRRQRRAVQEAFAFGLRNMWVMYTGFIAVGLGASLLIRHVDLKTEHTETRTGIKKKEEVGATGS